ncbi:MAG: hypothetical protein AB7E46_00415 [Desulfovibrio sp.]|jgi:hypothetical protein
MPAGKGGKGGQIFIIQVGEGEGGVVNHGEISARGGDGMEGGDGGQITFMSNNVVNYGVVDSSAGNSLPQLFEELIAELRTSELTQRDEIINDLSNNAHDSSSLCQTLERWYNVIGSTASLAGLATSMLALLK